MMTAKSDLLWHQQRRYALDALRVLVFGLLIFYHIAMAYVSEWEWHIKSAYQSDLLQSIMLWSSQWRMSLLFVISGAAVAFLLHKQGAWHFYVQRHSHLLLPLIFGSAVVVAPQVYVELKQQALIVDMGYGEFWWRYLFGGWLVVDGLPSVYGRVEPTFLTWNHLWFLAYTFCYSVIVCLLSSMQPLRPLGRVIIEAGVRYPLAFLLVLPVGGLWFAGWLLWQQHPPSHALFGDWFNHARYSGAFFWGFMYVRSLVFRSLLMSWRKWLLSAACASYLAALFVFNGGTFWGGEGLSRILEGVVWPLNAWLWVVTALAWAEAIFSDRNVVIAALNRRVYCFYILHQTVIILVLYRIQSLQLGGLWEPLVVLLTTVIVCGLGYQLVSRVPAVRILLGVFRKA